jgi:hypothetical protein
MRSIVLLSSHIISCAHCCSAYHGVAAFPGQGGGQHFNLCSLADLARHVSVETSPFGCSVRDIGGGAHADADADASCTPGARALRLRLRVAREGEGEAPCGGGGSCCCYCYWHANTYTRSCGGQPASNLEGSVGVRVDSSVRRLARAAAMVDEAATATATEQGRSSQEQGQKQAQEGEAAAAAGGGETETEAELVVVQLRRLVLRVVTDARDPEFPIFRSGAPPDYGRTGMVCSRAV